MPIEQRGVDTIPEEERTSGPGTWSRSCWGPTSAWE